MEALLHMRPAMVSAVSATIAELQRLEVLHFEKEERLFYPSLRPAFPDLLSQMDLQHEDIREVEQHVAEMLAAPPERPEPRWLEEVRRSGIELHDRIQHHIIDEEDHLFRIADDHLAMEEQEKLTSAFEKIQSRMPQT
jgi:DUF438 domain-containing protein